MDCASSKTTPEYNLLHEPWIRVIDDKGTLMDVGLLSAFEHAHEIRSIAGELPTQDLTIVRLMLAIMYAAYTRDDAPETLDDALDLWRKMWERGSFDYGKVSSYLESYSDRFFLFHPTNPFYQAPITKGTYYKSSKLIGDLSESGNKPRLFKNRNASEIRVKYAEAARWLLYVNAFDDTSSKPTVRGANMPSTGAGWLGKLGPVFIEGNSLYETLMLNFVLADRNDCPFPDGTAPWERPAPSVEERVNIPTPRSPLEILTLQSRRLLLEREGDAVTGFLLLGGDIVAKENALIEQMTVWKLNEDAWVPKRHDPSRSMWRDYSSILLRNAKDGEGRMPPGVVRWASCLEDEGLITYSQVRIRAVGVKYADKDFYVDDLVDDSLSLNAGLLSSKGDLWNTRIDGLIEKTELCVKSLSSLSIKLSKLTGRDADSDIRNASGDARSRGYYALDQPFRKWLASVEVDGECVDETKMLEWVGELESCIKGIGKEMLKESGERAFVGTDMKDNSTVAYNIFLHSIRKITRGDSN